MGWDTGGLWIRVRGMHSTIMACSTLIILAWSVLALAALNADSEIVDDSAQWSEVDLLEWKSVQQELKLQPSQAAEWGKVRGWWHREQAKLPDLDRIRHDNLSPERLATKLAALEVVRQRLNQELRQRLQTTLTVEQFTRLEQIALQLRGIQALKDERIRRILKLDATQYQALLREQMKSLADFRESEGKPDLARVQQQWEQVLRQVLTAPQWQAWEQLRGRPFLLRASTAEPRARSLPSQQEDA